MWQHSVPCALMALHFDIPSSIFKAFFALGSLSALVEHTALFHLPTHVGRNLAIWKQGGIVIFFAKPKQLSKSNIFGRWVEHIGACVAIQEWLWAAFKPLEVANLHFIPSSICLYPPVTYKYKSLLSGFGLRGDFNFNNLGQIVYHKFSHGSTRCHPICDLLDNQCLEKHLFGGYNSNIPTSKHMPKRL